MSEEYITDAMEMMGIVQPKKFETHISGWVPVFDYVAGFYKDPITALVFGRRWQYCGMEDGVCRASLAKIASDLHLDEATVMRHTEKLVKDGFLIDTTPDRRNRPHVYKDGGKVVMKTSIVAQSNTGIAQSNVGIAESKLIKQDNTKDNKPDGVDFEVSKLPVTSVKKAITQHFGLRVKWDGKTAREFLEWVNSEKITPEQIQKAAKTWQSDKRFNWQIPSLLLIYEKWNHLMGNAEIPQSLHPVFTPPAEPEKKYIPAPPRKRHE